MNGNHNMERCSSSKSLKSLDPENFINGFNEISKILVIYTGGTVGMLRNDDKVLVPAKNKLREEIKASPDMHDTEFLEDLTELRDSNLLVLPYVENMSRVAYEILEYETLLDSCNISMDDWSKIALDIYDNYENYDGFVILHGTDTLAYTASALSFMLENLGKTVIVTGSQVPIFQPVSDGRDNFVSSLLIAGTYIIPEVSVFFNHKLFRGNRTTKVSSVTFAAFDSFNISPLAMVGTSFEIDEKAILRPKVIDNFKVHTQLNQNVGLIRMFPCISSKVLKASLSAPVEGVVIQSYGSGNIPSIRSDLLDELKNAIERGIIIVNCTQCLHGSVSDAYATGKCLTSIGVIPGGDMTPEAALTKLAYVLSKSEWDVKTKKKMMKDSIRGELTIKYLIDGGEMSIAEAISSTLIITDPSEVKCIEKLISHSLVCNAIIKGDVNELDKLKDRGVDFNARNVDMKTPLHIAASIGKLDVVTFLLLNGANAHVRDSYGHTPLLEAIRQQHEEVVEVLRKSGCHLQRSTLGEYLCRASGSGELKKLKLFKIAGAKMNCKNSNGRTPLHEAVLHNKIDVVKYLMEIGANVNEKDMLGISPIDIAVKMNLSACLDLLQN